MPTITAQPSRPPDLSWLSQVRESTLPLGEQCPIWVRHGVVRSGTTVPYPEEHPFFEFGTILSGSGTQFVGKEQAIRKPGDLFIAGPGVPHWFEVARYPISFASVYFLPAALLNASPGRDGLRLLRRFAARQSLSSRLVRPPPRLDRELRRGFREMASEFEGDAFGRELRLSALLSEMLVRLMRWSGGQGTALSTATTIAEWDLVARALRFLQQNHARAIYANDLASDIGISETGLKRLFRDTLGMPWGRYLQSYRVHRAAAMLSSSDAKITNVALAVGFESLSHFNATFRALMDVSPKTYVKHNTSDPDQAARSKRSADDFELRNKAARESRGATPGPVD